MGVDDELHYSTYVRTAAQDGIIADRPAMIEHYIADVRRLRRLAIPPPSKPAATLRLATWNLNVLMGPDGRSVVAPDDVASVIRSIDADVLVLQEVPLREAEMESWSSAYHAPMERVARLDALLRDLGYSVIIRSPCSNPSLLASRLPVRRTEQLRLDDAPVATVNGDGTVWRESRGAAYAEVELCGDGAVGVYATHLHHKDSELRGAANVVDGMTLAEAGGTLVAGVRRREAEALLRHSESRAGPAVAATFVLADFNQPLAAHYTEAEWRAVTLGLTSLAVGQPESDGVADAMAAAGFRCAYESATATNFGRRRAPPMTHWTGTTVDFAYVRAAEAAVAGAYVHFTPLSDHLPVIVDWRHPA